MPLTFDLDHVALAALDTSGALRFLTGVLGAPNLEQRIVGFRDGVKGTKIEILPVQPTPFLDCTNAGLASAPSGNRLLDFARAGWRRVGPVLASLVGPARLVAAPLNGSLPVIAQPVHRNCVVPCTSGVGTVLVSAAPYTLV